MDSVLFAILKKHCQWWGSDIERWGKCPFWDQCSGSLMSGQYSCMTAWKNRNIMKRFTELVVVVQSLSCVWLCDSMDYSISGSSISSVFHYLPSLLKFMSIESVMLSNHFILCCPLLLLTEIFPSIKVFSNELAPHIRWPKYWSFSISPFNEYSGLISFRTGLISIKIYSHTSS